jgi:hypothetical protein
LNISSRLLATAERETENSPKKFKTFNKIIIAKRAKPYFF